MYLRLVAVTLVICVSAVESNSRQRRQEINFQPDNESDPPCSAAGGSQGVCVALSRCVIFQDEIVQRVQNPCQLSTGDQGICCPPDGARNPGDGPSPVRITQSSQSFNGGSNRLAADDVSQASSAAAEALQQRQQLEAVLLNRGIFIQPNTPESAHAVIVQAFPEAIELGRQAVLTGTASKNIALRLGGNPAFTLPKISIRQTPLQSACPPEPECPATKYKSSDGSCNNLKNKDWGKSFRAFNRLLPPSYADDLETPRAASDKTPLPSARQVSQTVIPDVNNKFPHITTFLMSWGQFIDHDMTLTPVNRGANGTSISCCSAAVLQNPELKHPECFAIDIPQNDDFFSNFQQTCMEFVRTIAAPRPDCTLGPREQMNQLTAYLDASMIYGSRETTLQGLRDKQQGRLRATATGAKDLPPHQNGAGCRGSPDQQMFCFQAGDLRVSEQPHLSVLHVVFLREHNRIVKELAAMNPGWNDEILYQEARRILGAMVQHITYNEFLPVVLGRRVMKSFGLLPLREGFANDYDPNLDGTILNEFSTAAYRFGHSLVPGAVTLAQGNRPVGQEQLRNKFLQPFDAPKLDRYIEGAAGSESMVVDNAVTEELTNHLFERGNRGFGLDLAALNIQRGRDHGLRPYNDYREFCGLRKAQSFEDLQQWMVPEAVNRMKSVYKDVNDIDLWAGGVSENPLPGGIVGPTVACILAEQFRRLKQGDRFYYEHGRMQSSFTEAQLEEIRKVSLARLLCDNSDNLQSIQPLVMFKPADWNPPVDCSSQRIPKMDLSAWKNEPVWS